MSDDASTNGLSNQADDKTETKRFRSPPYPAIDLGKAVERAGELYPKSLHHPVSVSVLASAWVYGKKSSGLFATLAALKQFGLLLDEGSGDKRRFRLTERAIRIVRDPDPGSEKRLEAIRHLALAPKIHAELWEKYGVAGASGAMDVALKSYLTVDRTDEGEAPYSDKAAEELIDEFKNTIAYAGLSESDTLPSNGEDNEDSGNLPDHQNGDDNRFGGAEVGDLIQREANGVLTLEKPLKVRAIEAHEGQKWVFVEGHEVGIPMNEVLVEKKAESKPDQPTAPILPIDVGISGTRKEVTDLDEGGVILTLPESLSQESVVDLEQWMDLIIRKAKRRAGIVDDKQPKGDKQDK